LTTDLGRQQENGLDGGFSGSNASCSNAKLFRFPKEGGKAQHRSKVETRVGLSMTLFGHGALPRNERTKGGDVDQCKGEAKGETLYNAVARRLLFPP
jgi:hypothetical protein